MELGVCPLRNNGCRSIRLGITPEQTTEPFSVHLQLEWAADEQYGQPNRAWHPPQSTRALNEYPKLRQSPEPGKRPPFQWFIGQAPRNMKIPSGLPIIVLRGMLPK
jgi:hypothetical protein